MKRIASELAKLNRGKRAYAIFVLCAMTALALPAQTFTTRYSFDGRNGALPSAALVQATNGDLYGTTERGGAGSAMIRSAKELSSQQRVAVESLLGRSISENEPIIVRVVSDPPFQEIVKEIKGEEENETGHARKFRGR